MRHSYLFGMLVSMLHQAFLDENLDRNLPWHGNIPYSFLSEEWRTYEERGVEYILGKMIEMGMLREEFIDLLKSKY